MISVQAKCREGLKWGFEMVYPDVRPDERGYVGDVRDNLIPGASLAAVHAEFAAGAGGELKRNMRAVHSSSALAVNAFAPLREAGLAFSLAGQDDLRVTGFEVKRTAGIISRTPPHLDVMTESRAALVAIESKCTEYMARKKASFSEDYSKQIIDQRSRGPWYAEMLRLKRSPDTRHLLDVAQLIKHAFGLAFAGDPRPTTLLYLYWEPRDASLAPLFAEHRAEIAEFEMRVAGGNPSFTSMTYAELWQQWLVSENPKLRDHGRRLRARYWVPGWAWEGVSFDGDTITDAGFHDLD